jgi:delta8-fatty-acid desaturase
VALVAGNGRTLRVQLLVHRSAPGDSGLADSDRLLLHYRYRTKPPPSTGETIALPILFLSISPSIFQFVLSHYSRPTADLGPTESFAARQLRTTVDVVCPPSLAFLHGGLHLQVTHHLFPRLPRHNLMEASMMVKEFAREWDLEYAEFGFIRGNQDVRNILRQVADQAKIVGIVAEHHAQEAMKKSM